MPWCTDAAKKKHSAAPMSFRQQRPASLHKASWVISPTGNPQAERRKRRASSVRAFLESQYEPWATAHRKTGAQTVVRVRRAFPDPLLNQPMTAISAWQLEQWRTTRRKDGIKDTTTNRDLTALRAVLSKAIEWGVLTTHPLRTVKPAKVDAIGRLRYLSPDEETRVRAVLEARDTARRDHRHAFNVWRAERGYQQTAEYGLYTDHMTPIVLLALNTGLRRGELLALRWCDIDIPGGRLTLTGTSAKTGLTRRLPLNSEAATVLQTWRTCVTAESGEPDDDAVVFAGPDGDPMFSLKTAWKKIATAAKLRGFTFHDLRHTFASKLVQAGVDLNTVRELLGHRDIKMTLRCAHLAPEHHAAAVAKLIG